MSVSKERNINMKITAIVILYNPEKYVIDNIQSYAGYVDNVIAVDNSDKHISSIVESIKLIYNLSYISLNGNYGIAYALNIGIDKGLKNGCDWILTMDQDSRFNGNLIETYKEFLNTHNGKNIGALCPIYLFDRVKEKKQTVCKAKKLVMQSANLVNAQVIREIGMYNEKLFIDGVDYEYCFRMRKAGYLIVQCANAKLKHAPAETRVLKFGNCTIFKYGIASPLRYYYQARNLLYIAIKYKSLRILCECLYKLAKILFLFDNKMSYLRMYREGMLDCINNKFGKYDESR